MLKSHYNTSNWSLWCSGEHMLIEPIESLEKHTVGWGPARTAAEENMWGPVPPAQDCYCNETCKHVSTDTHYNTHFTCNMTFFCCANLALGCVVASRFFFFSFLAISSHVTFNHPLRFPGELGELWHPHKSTHSVWHQALWWDAPWPALIHRGESKWRGSKIDRSKDSLSELKANRH